MKLNIYSFIFFGLILIILYPIIFYFSDKRINNENNRLTTYEYNIRGFLSLDNISRSTFYSTDNIKLMNNKYFDGEPIIKFIPNEKFSISESYSLGIERDINLLFDSDINLLPTNNLSVIKNNEIILLLGDVVIFYFDLRNIFSFVNEELKKTKYLKSNINKNCGLIEQKLTTMRNINYSIYEFDFSIKQKVTPIDTKTKNQNDIMSIYKNCFSKKLDMIGTNLENHLKNFENIQTNDFERAFARFLSNEKKFIFDQNESQKLRESILEVKNELKKRLFNIDFNFQIIKPVEIVISQKFQKNFNMYVVSFIISFLFTLIIFYFLFFLKNHIKILKKIF